MGDSRHQPGPAGAKRRILIADDSDTIRAQISAMLADDYECLTAADGKEALEKAAVPGLAAILLDIEMPILDGVAVLKGLKADPATARIPVVMVTRYIAGARMVQCSALGCAGFVLKPIQPVSLFEKLQQVMTAT